MSSLSRLTGRPFPLRAAGAAGLIALTLAACSGGAGSSTAADPFIAQAADDEEREALIQARDDIDAEMRVAVAGRDAELERLTKENAELKARLASRRKP